MLPRPNDKISPVDAEVQAQCLIHELDLDRGTMRDHLSRLEVSELVTPSGVFNLGYYFTEDDDSLTLGYVPAERRIDFLLPEMSLRTQKWEARAPLLSAVAFLRQTVEAAHRFTGSGLLVHPSLYEHETQFSAAVAFAVAAPAPRLRELERENRLAVREIETEFRLPRDLAIRRLATYRRFRPELLAASHTHHDSMAYYRRKSLEIAIEGEQT
jgi:hypothetical protein